MYTQIDERAITYAFQPHDESMYSKSDNAGIIKTVRRTRLAEKLGR